MGERDRFDKFTERSRKAISFTQEEAERLQSPLIEPPHFGLGIIKEGEGLAVKILVKLGVNLDELKTSLETVTVKGSAESPNKPLLSERSKKVIELTAGEARRLNHHYMGTEHILLALFAEGGGDNKSETVIVFENNFGVSKEKFEEEVVKIQPS